MSNKIYKSKMKDENRLLGKFVNNIINRIINYLCVIIFKNNSNRNIIS